MQFSNFDFCVCSESKPAKTSSALDFLADDVIPINTEARRWDRDGRAIGLCSLNASTPPRLALILITPDEGEAEHLGIPEVWDF